MKKTFLSFFGLSIALITTNVLLTSSSGGRASVANSGNTGAPSESTTCRSCHGTGFGVTISINITDTSGSTVTSYIPGDTLEVEVEVNNTGSPSRYGFQIVSLDSANSSISDWINPSSNTQIVTARSRTYAEHDGKSSTSTFSSQWVAPISGTGSVTFYAGGAAVNNNGGTSGDGGNTTSLILKEDVTSSIIEFTVQSKLNLFPNPVVDLINIELDKPSLIQTVIEIRDINGRIVLEESIAFGTKTTQLNVASLQKGQYFAILKTNEQLLQQQKFIKN